MANSSMRRNRALKIALIGLMAATLEVGKLALAPIPNVEVVTLLCGVYGYVFGLCGIIATYVFIGLETLIWGVNTWVITYLIHWGVVTLVFALLGKFKVKNIFIITAVAVALVACFGVLSSLIDTGLLTGFLENFWKRFAIIYVRGLGFYITEIVCNLILFPILFKPLVYRIEKILPDKFRGMSD